MRGRQNQSRVLGAGVVRWSQENLRWAGSGVWTHLRDGNDMRAGPGSGVRVTVETGQRCTDAGVRLRLGTRLWWALGWELGKRHNLKKEGGGLKTCPQGVSSLEPFGATLNEDPA